MEDSFADPDVSLGEDADEQQGGLGGQVGFLLIGLNIFACGLAYNYFFGNRCGLNYRLFYNGSISAGEAAGDNPGEGADEDGEGRGRVGRLDGMSLEDRKEFVANVLKTEKFAPGVEKKATLAASSRHSILDENVNDLRGDSESPAVANSFSGLESTSNSDSRKEIDLEGQLQQLQSSTKGNGERSGAANFDEANDYDDDALDVSQQCAICLERFVHDEEICCSHNRNCLHRFHRPCISAWLLKHEDCPCCRRNYLDLESRNDGEGDENEEEENNSDVSDGRRETNVEAERGESLAL